MRQHEVFATLSLELNIYIQSVIINFVIYFCNQLKLEVDSKR